MLRDKKHPDYDAMLVANARLHLPTVLNGQMSELFFETMREIVKRKVYLGYRRINGKEVKLSGFKDFLHNFHYGLGVRDMTGFICACIDIETSGQTGAPIVAKFINWLHQEDEESFAFPQSFWEFRRLKLSIVAMRNNSQKKLNHHMLQILYLNKPDCLKYIGRNRKYETVAKAYQEEIDPDVRRPLFTLKARQYPTESEIEDIARQIYAHFDKRAFRLLLRRMIDVYKINHAVKHNFKRGIKPFEPE